MGLSRDDNAPPPLPLTLPPPHLRKGPPANQQDDHYIRTAVTLTDSILSMLQLGTPEDVSLDGKRILDLGCGPMRLLTGLCARGVSFSQYVGVDVQAESIDWAHHQFQDPRVSAYLIDFENERYNPGGTVHSLNLPEPDGSFDLIVLRSVFTHMRWRHIVEYLRELGRILAPQGHLYVSAFAELGVPEEAENPTDYRRQNLKPTPLHRVRINRHRFETAAFERGLHVRAFAHDVLGQSTFVFGHSGEI